MKLDHFYHLVCPDYCPHNYIQNFSAPVQSGPGSDCNKEALRIPQSSSITEAS